MAFCCSNYTLKYESRCREIVFHSLQIAQGKGYLIQVYKVMLHLISLSPILNEVIPLLEMTYTVHIMEFTFLIHASFMDPF